MRSLLTELSMLKSSVSSRASADCFILLHASNVDILSSCFSFFRVAFLQKIHFDQAKEINVCRVLGSW